VVPLADYSDQRRDDAPPKAASIDQGDHGRTRAGDTAVLGALPWEPARALTGLIRTAGGWPPVLSPLAVAYTSSGRSPIEFLQNA